MKRKKSNLSLRAILGIVFIFLAIPNIGLSQQMRNPFKDWFPVIKVEEVKPDEVKPKPVFDLSKYKLQGVVWGSHKPKAVINDKIYNVGDMLDEAQITDINKNGVFLNFDEKEYGLLRSNPMVNKEESVPSQEESGEKTGRKTGGGK